MESNHSGSGRVVKNASWLIAGKLLHALFSFLIGLITARYLGPENYGLINYAAAYTTFFAALCNLGLSSVLVKHFVEHPEEEGETVGTALLMRGVSSILSAVMIVGVVSVVDRGEPLTLAVVALYSVGVVFQIFDTLNYWFQARLESKYYAVSTLIAYLLVSGYKILLLVLKKNVQWFAISNGIEFAVVGLLLILFYLKRGGSRFSFSVAKAKKLFHDSRSFIVAGMMIAIYASTDRLMLKQMIDSSEVSYYALAVSFSSSWGFLLSAVIDSMSPEIMRQRKSDPLGYAQSNRRMYAIVFYLATFVSLGVTVVAPWLIRFLYGEQYLPAVEPLRVIVWYASFSYLGVARNTWIVCEEKQKYVQIIYIASAAINVALNLLLIPLWRASGAALASLITQFITVFIVPCFIPPFRENVRMMLDAVLLRNLGQINIKSIFEYAERKFSKWKKT